MILWRLLRKLSANKIYLKHALFFKDMVKELQAFTI